jgi:hypothetical protein
MGIRGFERRLERMVEGVFARAFKSGLRPVELGRRIAREMDDHRSIGVRGTPIAPNHFTIEISPTDDGEFEDVRDALVRELGDAAREHARDEGYVFMGPVEVELVAEDRLHTGQFRISSRMREGEGGSAAGSLVLPTGQRFTLGEHTVTVGRRPESNIVLGDPKVSRSHAEIRPQGDGYLVVDLGSTNGTTVNGVRISERALRDGDEIRFGSTQIRFEAS